MTVLASAMMPRLGRIAPGVFTSLILCASLLVTACGGNSSSDTTAANPQTISPAPGDYTLTLRPLDKVIDLAAGAQAMSVAARSRDSTITPKDLRDPRLSLRILPCFDDASITRPHFSPLSRFPPGIGSG